MDEEISVRDRDEREHDKVQPKVEPEGMNEEAPEDPRRSLGTGNEVLRELHHVLHRVVPLDNEESREGSSTKGPAAPYELEAEEGNQDQGADKPEIKDEMDDFQIELPDDAVGVRARNAEEVILDDLRDVFDEVESLNNEHRRVHDPEDPATRRGERESGRRGSGLRHRNR